ncbi:MAG: NADH-quinone oxidoreductase subunit K [Candidatus Riflebacteria bacterium]|nr:NADH-quinone oxidoreductase subunit K [Candidatus Riflebacteria bacterium]
MNNEAAMLFNLYSVFFLLMFVCGLYCIIATKNMIRVLIGIELLAKTVTLLIAIAGYLSGHLALAQAIIITFIIVEVILVPVVAGLILGVFRKNDSIDVTKLRELKG